MSAFLPRIVRNTRHSAETGPMRCKSLDIAQTRFNVAGVRVWQEFQSFPAFHRYPLNCGRLCVSPSYPPAFFTALTAAVPDRCRYFASPLTQSFRPRVTQRHFPAMINRIRLLPKGASNASRKNNSIDHGLGDHGGAFRLQPRGHYVPLRLFHGRRSAGLNPLPLTNSKRFPVHFAPRGRFVVSFPNKKDSPCSRRS